MRFLADENFDGDVLRGIRLLNPDADIVRLQQTEVFRADDQTILEWTAKEQRVLLTYDVHTMNWLCLCPCKSGAAHARCH